MPPPPPPRRQRASIPPFTTTDPTKIILKSVHLFTSTSQSHPIASLTPGVDAVSDGLVLTITTEGLFIDDEGAKRSHREWDVKAWSIRLLEVFCPRYTPPPRGGRFDRDDGGGLVVESLARGCNAVCREGGKSGVHMLRAAVRDADEKRVVFVVGEGEAWKLVGGLRRIRDGSVARGLRVEGMGAAEARLALLKMGL